MFRSLRTMEEVLSLVSSSKILVVNFWWSVSRHVSTNQIFEELDEILDNVVSLVFIQRLVIGFVMKLSILY